MPYITRKDRINVSSLVPDAETAGRLNYEVTTLVDDYLYQQGVSYQTLNEVIGVLECAKLELYRRLAVPYEDKKRAVNGDVYRTIMEAPNG